jgi:hypothetical protein
MRNKLLLLMILACVGLSAPSPLRAAEGGEDERFRKSFDEAIDRGLEFLRLQQQPNGSWENHAGITSLAVMAFMAKGYLPGHHPYGETLNRGLDFILGLPNQNGYINTGGGGMYTHCMTTLMLSEVSGMVDPDRQERLDELLSKALAVILTAQKVSKGEAMRGGWRYEPNAGDSDISLSGWAFMALRAAKNSASAVPREAIEQGLQFLRRCRSASDGGFAYTPGSGSGPARTGVGLLCLELGGEHRTVETLKAGLYLADKGWKDPFYYYSSYYAAQGMFQLGGEEWQAFAAQFYEAMLGLQEKDGSWRNMGGEGGTGPSYRTAMAILSLSVSYRQLPIYQR